MKDPTPDKLQGALEFPVKHAFQQLRDDLRFIAQDHNNPGRVNVALADFLSQARRLDEFFFPWPADREQWRERVFADECCPPGRWDSTNKPDSLKGIRRTVGEKYLHIELGAVMPMSDRGAVDCVQIWRDLEDVGARFVDRATPGLISDELAAKLRIDRATFEAQLPESDLRERLHRVSGSSGPSFDVLNLL